mgnify:CR=1 FL=1
MLLAPISRGTLPCAMHGHAPWLLAGSLHSSPAGAFAGTPRNVLCPLQSVAPCTPLRCLVVDVGLSPLSKLDLSAQMQGLPNTPLWVRRRGLACFSVLFNPHNGIRRRKSASGAPLNALVCVLCCPW